MSVSFGYTMTEKDKEFKMRVVEKAVVPGRKGKSVGTGSSTGSSRFTFTVSQESFRCGRFFQGAGG